MTDANLREIERRFRASGSVEDEAAWLNERVRLSDLEQDGLHLAASLGSAAARLVAGTAAPPEVINVVTWGRSLVSDDTSWPDTREKTEVEPLMRAALAATECAWLAVLRSHPDDFAARAQQGFDAVRSWIVSGERPELRSAILLAQGVPGGLGAILQAVASDSHEWVGRARRALVVAAEVVPASTLKRAVAEALVPWALGHGDPVKARLLKRGEIELTKQDLRGD